MSYTFNTGNPVGPNGSADARDLVDNAQVADRLINGAELTVPDRIGVQRRTWNGIQQAVVNYVNRGEWVTATAYQVNDIWRDGPTGAFYLVLADYTSGVTAAADIAGGNVVVHQPKDWVVSVATIADLRALEPAVDGQQCELLGHTVAGLGGGMFYADYSSIASDDNGVTVVTAGGRRWVRKISGYVTPEMFGARPGVDCTSAVQSAIDSSPADFELVYSGGVEYIQGEVTLSGKGRAVITGYGALLKGPNSRVPGYFNAAGCDNLVFRGFIVDHMFGVLPQYTVSDYPNEYNVAVFGDTVGVVDVYDCVFKNLYNRSVSLVNFQSATVRNCKFSSPQQNQDQVLDYVGFSTGQRVSVYNNNFISAEPTSAAFGTCGVFCAGISELVTIRDNTFYNCGRDNTGTHRLAVIDFYFDCKRVIVKNNKSYNGFAQFMRVSGCESGSIKCNEHYTSAAAESGYTMLSLEGYSIGAAGRGNKDIEVSGNKFVDEFSRHEVCVGVFAYDWGLPSENVSIHHNTIVGAKKAVNVIGPCSDISVHKNTIRDYLGLISFQVTSAQPITSDKGTESNSFFGRIRVVDNVIDTTPNGSSAIDFTTVKSPPYSGLVGVFVLDANEIVRTGGSAGFGISVNAKMVSSRSSYVFIRNNRIRGVSTAIYPRECSYLAMFNNDCATSSDAIVESDNDIVERQKNKRNGSITQGVATLSAGSVTVSTPEIRSGDQVLLTRTQSGGSLGHLYVPTINNGSSFVISSTSGSDSSKVFWEILY